MSRDIILPGGDTLKLWGSSYTPEQMEDILTKALRQSGDNLLRNAYFIGGGSQQGGGQFPINARGQTTYTSNGYGINGWKNTATSVTLAPDGLQLSFNSLYANFHQIIDWLPPGTYTFSVLFDEQPSGLYAEYFANDGELHKYLGDINQKLCSFTFSTAVPMKKLLMSITRKASEVVTVKAIAAELVPGDQQTLAHQDANGNLVPNAPPQDFGLELLTCQRYFQTFATQSLRPTKGADFRPVMRTENPTLGTITLPDGTVLYTASSEL